MTGEASAPSTPTLAQFLLGLRTSWQEGEVRPTAKPKKRVAPYCRYVPDPFEAVSAQVRAWFEAEPSRTARELLERLQGEHPGVYPHGQLRTLQRRLKGWRREVAQALVFGPPVADEPAPTPSLALLQSVAERGRVMREGPQTAGPFRFFAGDERPVGHCADRHVRTSIGCVLGWFGPGKRARKPGSIWLRQLPASREHFWMRQHDRPSELSR